MLSLIKKQQMNTQQIKVGEKLYPVKYGFNALRIFCKESGIELQDIEKIAQSMSLDHAINLVWAGLKDGARVEKIEFDLTIEDVADMMDEDNTVITQCMELFIASFVKPNSEEKK